MLCGPLTHILTTNVIGCQGHVGDRMAFWFVNSINERGGESREEMLGKFYSLQFLPDVCVCVCTGDDPERHFDWKHTQTLNMEHQVGKTLCPLC